MFIRALRLTVVSALVLGVAVGCAPTPAPSVPAPVFTSEAEAFAAAEETYRAYVEALNGVDLSDPETFEAVYAWTTGDANANERTGLSRMHADGWSVRGSTTIDRFEGQTFVGETITALACTNVAAIEVFDSSGNTVVPEERPARYALELHFAIDPAAEDALLISTSNAVEDPSCE